MSGLVGIEYVRCEPQVVLLHSASQIHHALAHTRNRNGHLQTHHSCHLHSIESVIDQAVGDLSKINRRRGNHTSSVNLHTDPCSSSEFRHTYISHNS